MGKSQAKIQGIFNERIEHLNKFRRLMTDVQLNLNLISQDVIVILNENDIDVYHDSSIKKEICRINKRVLISKSPDMSYVQETFDMLVEDEKVMPWLVILTMTDLPRHLNRDDSILIEGENGVERYTVSKVAPINRLNDGVQKVLIYNERNLPELLDSVSDEDDDDDLWDLVNDGIEETPVIPPNILDDLE